MQRLTAKRCNGIKVGYWSPAKKEDITQRLGAYEDTGLEPEEIQESQCWISVENRLPNNEDDVLICTRSKNGSKNIDKGYFFEEQNRWIHRGTAEVTHWMPIPALPQEVPHE